MKTGNLRLCCAGGDDPEPPTRWTGEALLWTAAFIVVLGMLAWQVIQIAILVGG